MKKLKLGNFVLGFIIFIFFFTIFPMPLYSQQEIQEIEEYFIRDYQTVMIIVSLIYLAGGKAVPEYPDPLAEEPKWKVYIDENPPGIELDIDKEVLLNKVADYITIHKSFIRQEAEDRDVPYKELLIEHVEQKLYREYPELEPMVNKAIETFKTELTPALKELIGDVEYSQEDFDEMVNAYIEEVKAGDVNTEELLDIVTVYKVGLKDTVADFVKEATGEDFNIFNGSHAGLLSYWADWANSFSALVGKDDALQAAKAAIKDRKAILSDLKEHVYNGHEFNVFAPTVGRLLSYFADLVVYREGYDIAKVKEDIAAFGEKLAQDKEALKVSVSDLIGKGDIDTPEEDKVLTEFSTLILKHLLADFDEEAIEQFKEANKDDPAKVWQTLLDRRYTADREDIKAVYTSGLSIDDFFTGEKHDKTLAYAKQKAEDMLIINNKFQDEFGESYDVLKPKELEALFEWGFMVDDYVRYYLATEEMTETEAHRRALEDVLMIIENLNEFPGVDNEETQALIGVNEIDSRIYGNTEGVNAPIIEPDITEFDGFMW